jgi:hypothetical protein
MNEISIIRLPTGRNYRIIRYLFQYSSDRSVRHRIKKNFLWTSSAEGLLGEEHNINIGLHYRGGKEDKGGAFLDTSATSTVITTQSLSPYNPDPPTGLIAGGKRRDERVDVGLNGYLHYLLHGHYSTVVSIQHRSSYLVS